MPKTSVHKNDFTSTENQRNPIWCTSDLANISGFVCFSGLGSGFPPGRIPAPLCYVLAETWRFVVPAIPECWNRSRPSSGPGQGRPPRGHGLRATGSRKTPRRCSLWHRIGHRPQNRKFGPLAQWLEQQTHNLLVVGSNPTGPTSIHPHHPFEKHAQNGSRPRHPCGKFLGLVVARNSALCAFDQAAG